VFNTAFLTATSGSHTFDVSGWTHGGSLTGAGDSAHPDTVAATKNADFTLTNSLLTTSDQMQMSLTGITVANLTATTAPHSFALNSALGKWTGAGALTNSGGAGTVTSSRDANFTLTNSSLAASDGLAMNLWGVTIANLTGTTQPHSFTLDTALAPWTGTGTL